MNANCGWLLLSVLTVNIMAFPTDGFAQQLTETRAIDRLPSVAPGTIIGEHGAERWNRTVLLAKPRIASGDVDRLSESVRDSVGQFTLSIVATVRDISVNGAAGTKFRLAEVGAAYSYPIQGRLTVITPDTAVKLGASLDFFSRQMLSENDKQLSSIKLIVRSESLVMFDTPAIMLSGQEHKDFTMRHLVWIDSGTGKLALLVWLLSVDESGVAVADKSMRLVAAGTEEDRKIHVDGRSFFLGIPSKHAFALESLPPGRDFQWSDETRPLAALPKYDARSIANFAAALNRNLNPR